MISPVWALTISARFTSLHRLVEIAISIGVLLNVGKQVFEVVNGSKQSALKRNAIA